MNKKLTCSILTKFRHHKYFSWKLPLFYLVQSIETNLKI